MAHSTGNGETVIVELHSSRCECEGSGVVKLPSGTRALCSPTYIMRLPFKRWEELGKPLTIEDANEAIRKAEEKENEG